MKPAPDLPLFRNAELNVLQARREALLKRLQGLRQHSHGRVELLGRLKMVTSEILALESAAKRTGDRAP